MIQIDMEMPKSCGGCKMSATDVCLKWLGLKRYELGSKRAIDCPLKEVPTGKWERHYSRPNVYADLFWHCSVCGYKNSNDYANRYHKYCPNCGSRMIEEQQGEQE